MALKVRAILVWRLFSTCLASSCLSMFELVRVFSAIYQLDGLSSRRTVCMNDVQGYFLQTEALARLTFSQPTRCLLPHAAAACCHDS